MDYKKDIHQGQQSEQAKEVKKPEGIGDSVFSGILKRTEKLVTALYMVTDCMEDAEPIKVELRSVGVRLLRETHSSVTRSAIEASLRFHDVRKSIAEIKSLLGIGATIGFISEMNFSILEKEFGDLERLIAEVKEPTRRFSLPHTFFDTSKTDTVLLEDALFKSEIPAAQKQEFQGTPRDESKGHIKDTQEKGQARPAKSAAGELVQKDMQKALSIGLKFERRSTILRIVKEKKQVTIKDISKIYNTCSEKTIQRELVALVNDGVLKKEGEKRWSRYSLAPRA